MKTITKLRNRKAISPVIATVILVAVAISVSVGVSYWMSGISAQYTEFEKIEIQTGYSTFTPSSGWLIDISLKNSGSAVSTITHLFINDVPVTLTADATETTSGTPDVVVDGFANEDPGKIVTDIDITGLSLLAGESATVKIWIDYGYAKLSSGTTVNVKLHSAGGMDYIKLVKLT